MGISVVWPFSSVDSVAGIVVSVSPLSAVIEDTTPGTVAVGWPSESVSVK